MDANELRRRRADALDGTFERRWFHTGSECELREMSSGILRFEGHASVTEHPYSVFDWEETIARGAFRRTLAEDPDVSLLIGHGQGGSGLPLARTKSGSLTLNEDSRGLHVLADLQADDPEVQALVPKLRRRDVTDMSIGFRVTDQRWSEDRGERRILAIGLHKGDVSIVSAGANDAASGSLRSATRGSSSRSARLPDMLTERRLRLEMLQAGMDVPARQCPTCGGDRPDRKVSAAQARARRELMALTERREREQRALRGEL